MKERKSSSTIRRRRPGIKEHSEKPNAGMSTRSRFATGAADDQFMAREQRLFDGPRFVRLALSSERTLFLSLLAFRIVNAFVVQTSFVPDEYWQSLEVAHKMVFGYGHLTWEWDEGIRGYSYPLVFAALYKILSLLHIDSRLLLKVPRLVQACLAATGDIYLYKLSAKLAGHRVARWALFCQLTSWFTFFCCTRTLTNCTEAVLTTAALFHFPWPDRPRSPEWKYVVLMGLAFVVRPTAAVVWLPLVLWHVSMHRRAPWRIVRLFVATGVPLLALTSLVDRVFYGRWLSVHYNFARFNVLSGLASFYGSHPSHWYLSQGLVVVMATHIVPFLLAVRHALQPAFLVVIAWTIAVFSFLPHKEFRFLLPILPMALHVCGTYLCRFTSPVCPGASSPTPRGGERGGGGRGGGGVFCRQNVVVTLLIITNLPLALYTSLVHQRGTLDVMKYLHDESAVVLGGGGLSSALGGREVDFSVLFLMPCHSTPFYSHIHRNVSLRYLHCEPNLAGVDDYTDEADAFYVAPSRWLDDVFATSDGHLPSHIVMFDCLESRIDAFLARHRYRTCARFFHTHVPDGRVGRTVVVRCRPSGRDDDKRRPRGG